MISFYIEIDKFFSNTFSDPRRLGYQGIVIVMQHVYTYFLVFLITHHLSIYKKLSTIN